MRTFVNRAAARLRLVWVKLRRTPKRRVAAWIEVATFSLGVYLAAVSWAAINEIEGRPPTIDAATSGFLEPADYPTPLPRQFALRHDCREIMRGGMFMRIRSRSDMGKFKPSTWRTLARAFIGWPPVDRGPGDVDLEILPFDDKPYPCRNLALHVPGTVADVGYTVQRSASHGEVLPLKREGGHAWARAADIVVTPATAPGFSGKLSFIWKDAVQYVGAGDIAIVLPIGYWQQLSTEVPGSQMTYLVKIQTPPGFRLLSSTYPFDEPEYLHPQGSINTFRVGPMLGDAPLVVTFREQLHDASKASRLVFWSTLFGFAVALVFETILSFARRFGTE